MAEEIDFTLASQTSTASVLSTVQKFEASNFVFKTPMNTIPNAMVITRERSPDGGTPIAEFVQIDDYSDSPPSSPGEPPALPATSPPDSDEEELLPSPPPKKEKKKREFFKFKDMLKSSAKDKTGNEMESKDKSQNEKTKDKSANDKSSKDKSDKAPKDKSSDKSEKVKSNDKSPKEKSNDKSAKDNTSKEKSKPSKDKSKDKSSKDKPSKDKPSKDKSSKDKSPADKSSKLKSPDESQSDNLTKEDPPSEDSLHEHPPNENLSRENWPNENVSSMEGLQIENFSGNQSPNENLFREKSPKGSSYPREKSPKESFVREKSPNENIFREKLPNESLFREKSPNEQLFRQSSPNENFIREKSSPNENFVREKSLYENFLREKSPNEKLLVESLTEKLTREKSPKASSNDREEPTGSSNPVSPKGGEKPMMKTAPPQVPMKLHQPNLSQVPRKSSLKKPKTKSQGAGNKLESTKGLWFNMNDQYPIENFSGREAILEQIHQVVHGQKSRDARPISRAIVLAGKPSMGKTEIARKFAFKFYVDCNGKGNVIWMDGSSKESITQALFLLEEKELLPLTDPGSTFELDSSVDGKEKLKNNKKKTAADPESELQERLGIILKNRLFQDNPTLFIFDNARTEEDIVGFIPKLAPFGHIPNVLVTSTNENNWNNARVINVAEFEFKEAVEFLVKNFQDCQGFTKFQAEDLAKELHRYPPLMQKAKKIVLHYLLTHGDSDRAILRLEKNIGLVRRLKGEEIIASKDIELAILATDRGVYYEEDPYIREYDGELRNHPVSTQIHQLEAVRTKVSERNDLTVLTVNQDSYILGMLAHLVGKHTKILALYDTDHADAERMALIRNQLNNDDEDLIKTGKIDLGLIEIPVVKAPKQSKTSTLLDKFRSVEKKQYDLILCNMYVEQDLNSVRKLLATNGRFVTCMTSMNVSSALKKADPKKIHIQILKHDFPELLVIATKL